MDRCRRVEALWMRFPQRQQHPLAHDRADEQGRANEEHAADTDGADSEVGEERAGERSGRSSGRDHAEQPLCLVAAEQLEKEAPKDRDDEQVEDAEKDPEELANPDWRGRRLQGDADEREDERHRRVGPGQERAAAEPRDQSAVNRNHGQ